jgi:hypothetical protein
MPQSLLEKLPAAGVEDVLQAGRAAERFIMDGRENQASAAKNCMITTRSS